ncbi:Rossmann-like domain-containing protein [Chloroflexota bacterium]
MRLHNRFQGGKEILEVIPALPKAKDRFVTMVDDHKLRSEMVRVDISTLTPEQAIGKPDRQDFALLGGKEVMIEAQFKQHFGQAFTNQPQNFNGILDDVLNLNLDTINNRAIFVATMNAVCSYLGIIGKVRHCRNQEPEDCGKKIADQLISQYSKIKIGMVGYQPAILENLVKRFSVENTTCSDLDTRNIGENKFGVTILDGSTENRNLIGWCDLLLATGSTHVNDTFDDLYREAISQNKPFVIFGVTGASIVALLRLDIICPLAR